MSEYWVANCERCRSGLARWDIAASALNDDDSVRGVLCHRCVVDVSLEGVAA